jgi:signal peptidase I
MEEVQNPFFNEPAPKKTSKFIILLQIVSVLTVIFLITWILLLEQNQVKGPSMQPNFVTGQFLLTNRIPSIVGPNVASTIGIDYQRGDVVVFQKPGLEDFVKRVIALPGETIRISEGRIIINGKMLEEKYIAETVYTNGGDLIRENGNEVRVPQGYYALIGDNRPQSNDSRYGSIGFIDRSWIKGKVILRIWPFDTFGFIPQGSYSLNN